MPNENRNRSALDTQCLLSESNIKESFRKSAVHDIVERIEKERKNKIKRLDKWFDDLEGEKLQAHTLKKLIRFQRINAPSKTMRICNTTPISLINPLIENEGVKMNITEYSYGMSGLNRCKNPFCSMCNRSRAGERAHRLKQGITGAMLKKYPVYFVTFTIPRSQNIEAQKEEIKRRWKRMNNLFQSFRRDRDIQVYTAKALDITFNPYVKTARYHLHIHGIVVLSEDIEVVDELMVRTWLNANHRDCKASHKSQDIQRVGLTSKDRRRVGRYVAKMAGLALEITHGQRKEAKSKNSWSLSEIMQQERHDGRKLGLEKAKEIYSEFLAGMKRVRTLDVSRNWDDLFQDTEAEKEQVKISIEIEPLKWYKVREDWVLIAEKIQFEIFQNSFLYNGETDHLRVYKVLKEARHFIDNLERKEDIIWFLQTQFD